MTDIRHIKDYPAVTGSSRAFPSMTQRKSLYRDVDTGQYYITSTLGYPELTTPYETLVFKSDHRGIIDTQRERGVETEVGGCGVTGQQAIAQLFELLAGLPEVPEMEEA